MLRTTKQFRECKFRKPQIKYSTALKSQQEMILHKCLIHSKMCRGTPYHNSDSEKADTSSLQ